LNGPCTTSNWFALQHAIPQIGRTFLPEEDQHNRNHVVILSNGFWQRRFGADPKILGNTLLLNNERWTVVGVMQPDFRPIGSTESPIYTPYVVRDNPHGLNVTARLMPGVSLEKLQADIAAQGRKLEGDMLLAQQKFALERELKLLDAQIKREQQQQAVAAKIIVGAGTAAADKSADGGAGDAAEGGGQNGAALDAGALVATLMDTLRQMTAPKRIVKNPDGSYTTHVANSE
jgi:hypothetical protein